MQGDAFNGRVALFSAGNDAIETIYLSCFQREISREGKLGIEIVVGKLMEAYVVGLLFRSDVAFSFVL